MAREIAFFGLGNLGRAIVKRMKEVISDADFYVWTQDVSRAELFASEIGAIRIIKPERIPKSIRYIFLCLFDSLAVQNILEKIPKDGKVIVDFTTNHPKKVLEFSEIIVKNGGEYIESPVLGSVIPASQGKLTLLVCGKEKIFDEVKPFLDAISSKIFYFGENFSQASYLKLVNNLVLGEFMMAISEAVAIGEILGFSPEIVLEVLSYGAGKSAILENKKEKLIKRDFSPHFSVSLIRKDLLYLKEIIEEKTGNVEIEELPFVFNLKKYDEAYRSGFSQLDFSSIFNFIKTKFLNSKEKNIKNNKEEKQRKNI
jgi:3-hydroxyisobutyrate dehydrogenase and related beta-hydroxyacid dehydrogenases